MSQNLIFDGQTRKGYIAAVERLHDYVRFEYRPMLPATVEAVENRVSNETRPEAVVQCISAAVAKHLESWSETGEKGPHDVKLCWRLPYPVLNRMYRIIAGIVASDIDPEDKETRTRTIADDMMDEMDGKFPGAEAMEAAEGNSVTG